MPRISKTAVLLWSWVCGKTRGVPATKAEEAGLKILEAVDAAKAADFIMLLLPDEQQADVYTSQIEPNLKEGNVLMFAHGLNIHFKQIAPPAGVDVIMVVPKKPGHTVRSQYLEGRGVLGLIAIHQDATGQSA